MSIKDKRDFKAYLANCTDTQVQNVYNKEKAAGRTEYKKLALLELKKRNIL